MAKSKVTKFWERNSLHVEKTKRILTKLNVDTNKFATTYMDDKRTRKNNFKVPTEEEIRMVTEYWNQRINLTELQHSLKINHAMSCYLVIARVGHHLYKKK